MNIPHVGGRTRRLHLRTSRLEAFSDGVFAIVITLLVLELAVPEDSQSDLLGAVVGLWPKYLAYLVSFATVGAVWLEHSIMTDYLERANSSLVRLNLCLLLVVTFIPFPTRLLGDYLHYESAERVAVTIYGLTLALSLLLVTVLWNYAQREGLLRQTAGGDSVGAPNLRLGPGLAGYGTALIVGAFFPIVAVFAYLVLALWIMVPINTVRPRRDQPKDA